MTRTPPHSTRRPPGRDAVALVSAPAPSTPRITNDYNDAQRALGVTVAVAVGPRKAATLLDTPERTIRNWCSNFGGLAALRDAAGDVVRSVEYAVVAVACQHLIDTMTDASITETLEVIRTLGAHGARPRADSDASTPDAPPVPVLIQLNVASDGSPPEMINVPPSPPRSPPGALDAATTPTPDDAPASADDD